MVVHTVDCVFIKLLTIHKERAQSTRYVIRMLKLIKKQNQFSYYFHIHVFLLIFFCRNSYCVRLIAEFVVIIKIWGNCWLVGGVSTCCCCIVGFNSPENKIKTGETLLTIYVVLCESCNVFFVLFSCMK